jgi:hypothetical protein
MHFQILISRLCWKEGDKMIRSFAGLSLAWIYPRRIFIWFLPRINGSVQLHFINNPVLPADLGATDSVLAQQWIGVLPGRDEWQYARNECSK